MNKSINLENYKKTKSDNNILEMFDIVENDYGIKVELTEPEIHSYLDHLYDLYKNKDIVCEYYQDMDDYFDQVMYDAIEENKTIDKLFLVKTLIHCYEVTFPIGIEREDIENVLVKASNKKIGG